MPAKVCPHCAVLTETEGETCPNCGRPYRRRTGRQAAYAGGAVVLVALGIVAGVLLAGGDDDSPPRATSAAPAAADQSPKQAPTTTDGNPRRGTRTISYQQAYKTPLGISREVVTSRFGPPLTTPAGEDASPSPGVDCIYYAYFGHPESQFRLCFSAKGLASIGTRLG